MFIGIRFVTLLLLICTALGSNAQSRTVYTFQQDDSLLKQTWYTQVMEKKKQLLASLDKKAPTTADYKGIYESQYTGIGELVKSDLAVTDDKAHKYLQAVVQKIITSNDELKSLKLRVFFTRDAWPNAFSMGDGTIAFNAGLFVYLDSEAEMVFVLCHELAHFYLDHSGKTIKKHVETVNSEAFKAEVKRLSKEEYMVNQKAGELIKTLRFDTRRHSRDNEAQADQYAYRFMKKTGYDCMAIKSCLSLLDMMDDSSLYKPVVLPDIFNSPDYPFKKRWIQKESSIFSQMKKDDSPLTQAEKDSMKSHPDCTKRIELLEDSIKGLTGKKFIVNEALFRELQREFPVEIMEQNYREGNLSAQLYYSLQLLQRPEYIPVAVYSIVRTLNELYESQKNHTLGLKVAKESRFLREDLNLLLRMLDRLRLDEITALSYHFCNTYYQQMKGYESFEKELRKAQLANK